MTVKATLTIFHNEDNKPAGEGFLSFDIVFEGMACAHEAGAVACIKTAIECMGMLSMEDLARLGNAELLANGKPAQGNH